MFSPSKWDSCEPGSEGVDTWRSQSCTSWGEGQRGKGGVHPISVKQDSVSTTSSVKLKLSERIFNHKRALKYTTQFFFAVLGTNTV